MRKTTRQEIINYFTDDLVHANNKILKLSIKKRKGENVQFKIDKLNEGIATLYKFIEVLKHAK